MLVCQEEQTTLLSCGVQGCLDCVVELANLAAVGSRQTDNDDDGSRAIVCADWVSFVCSGLPLCECCDRDSNPDCFSHVIVLVKCYAREFGCQDIDCTVWNVSAKVPTTFWVHVWVV